MGKRRLPLGWLVVLVCVTAGAVSVAGADTETHTKAFSEMMVSSPYETLVTVPKFYRPSGGYQLQSVRVSVTQAMMEATVGVENQLYSPASGTLAVTGSLEVESAGSPICAGGSGPLTLQFNLGPNDGAPEAGRDYLQVTFYLSFWPSGYAPDPAAWVGLADGEVQEVLIRGSRAGQVTGLLPGVVALYDYYPDPLQGTLQVQYTYVPEPAVLTLLALGGVAMVSRRRRPAAGGC